MPCVLSWVFVCACVHERGLRQVVLKDLRGHGAGKHCAMCLVCVFVHVCVHVCDLCRGVLEGPWNKVQAEAGKHTLCLEGLGGCARECVCVSMWHACTFTWVSFSCGAVLF